MSRNLQLTPAALYARVSSDRQDVDLSVAAQLRALRDYAEKNGYSYLDCLTEYLKFSGVNGLVSAKFKNQLIL